MKAKFLGYEITITYDDYSIFETTIQNIDEIEDVCKTLTNNDDTYEVEYKKKYKLEDGSFVYGKTEHISIYNPNIPQREILLRELDILIQPISVDDEIENENLEKCYKIIKKLLNKQNIEISELTLVASFRYALGRKTYIVSEIVENILDNWEFLSVKFKTKVKEEIEESIKNSSAGSDIDVKQWKKILDLKIEN